MRRRDGKSRGSRYEISKGHAATKADVKKAMEEGSKNLEFEATGLSSHFSKVKKPASSDSNVAPSTSTFSFNFGGESDSVGTKQSEAGGEVKLTKSQKKNKKKRAKQRQNSGTAPTQDSAAGSAGVDSGDAIDGTIEALKNVKLGTDETV